MKIYELLTRGVKLGAKFKLYFQRSAFYLSIANFVMILSNFKMNYGFEISAFILIPVGIIGVLLVGLIDYLFILPTEIKHKNKKNDLKKDLQRIEKKLDDMNTK